MSQQSQIVLKLREMILSGKFQPGERVAEVRVADDLGVSRTPVRYALGVLAREGLVVPTANQRGFVVREVTLKDILDATELRGVLEGMAARQLAENGVSAEAQNTLDRCIGEAAVIFEKGELAPGDGSLWAEINERFHDTIIDASANAPLIHALQINDQVPFSGAGAFLNDTDDVGATQRQYSILLVAQKQHETIVQCLLRGEGARVEALMREHCFLAIENINLFRSGIDGVRTKRLAA